MAVGFSATKADIDFRAGTLARDIRDRLHEVADLKVRLDGMTDPDLTALGYDSTDISRLRSAVNDLDKLSRIYLGTEVQATQYDFRTFAKWLTGVS